MPYLADNFFWGGFSKFLIWFLRSPSKDLKNQIRNFEKPKKQILSTKYGILFNQTCLNEELHPTYIYIYMINMKVIYIYINNEDLLYKSFCTIIDKLSISLQRFLHGFCTAPTWFLHGSCTVPTQFLHGSYTVPTRLLCGSYTAPTRYLHSSYTVPTRFLHGSYSNTFEFAHLC